MNISVTPLFLFCVVSLVGRISAHQHFCQTCADRAASLLGAQPAHPSPQILPNTTFLRPAGVLAQTLSLSDVELTAAAGIEYTAQQTNIEYLLALPVTSLTYNFRKTAGLDTGIAVPLGGWETPLNMSDMNDPGSREGDDRGHFVGHWLSASALAVNSTGNSQLRENAEAVVSDLAVCQKANGVKYPEFGPGYLAASPVVYFECLEHLWQRPCRYMQAPPQLPSPLHCTALPCAASPPSRSQCHTLSLARSASLPRECGCTGALLQSTQNPARASGHARTPGQCRGDADSVKHGRLLL